MSGYDEWDNPPPPRAPNPTQVAHVLSSRCVGYQTEDETAGGSIRRSVWSGLVEYDADLAHPVLRYWVDGGGAREYQETAPRIDRYVPERPGVTE